MHGERDASKLHRTVRGVATILACCGSLGPSSVESASARGSVSRGRCMIKHGGLDSYRGH